MCLTHIICYAGRGDNIDDGDVGGSMGAFPRSPLCGQSNIRRSSNSPWKSSGNDTQVTSTPPSPRVNVFSDKKPSTFNGGVVT